MTLLLSGTDGLSDVDGSAATPAIRGTDANTGIFFPAADTIAFSEGGAEIARFDSSGRLAIGTTSASSPLTVQGDSGGNGVSIIGRSGGQNEAWLFWYQNGGSTLNAGIMGDNQALKFAYGSGNTERMRLNNSGTVILQGGNTSATGVGITFPATQSASADANTLDDYEEGNWTPVVQGVTTSGTASYASQIGRYVKIGRQVTITLDINYSSATGTGIFQIAGLPFSSSSGHPSTGSVMTSNLDWNTGTMVTLYKPGNNAVLELYSSSDNSGWLQMNMDAAGEIIGSVTYFT
jgi:hypothetical protein